MISARRREWAEAEAQANNNPVPAEVTPPQSDVVKDVSAPTTEVLLSTEAVEQKNLDPVAQIEVAATVKKTKKKKD